MGQLLRVLFIQVDFTFWAWCALFQMSILGALTSRRPKKLTVPYMIWEHNPHHSVFPLGWTLRVFMDLEGFWHSVITFPQGNLQAVHTHGTLSFMRGHDSHSPGCHVWHSQGQWGLSESLLPNSLWRKSTPFPNDSLPEDHCSATAFIPDERPGLTQVALILDSHLGTHNHCQGYLYFLCAWFYQHPLLSFLPDSLLISDSARTLAKPVKPTALFPSLIFKSTCLLIA